MQKCPVCGTLVEDGEEYCPDCGYDIYCIDEYEQNVIHYFSIFFKFLFYQYLVFTVFKFKNIIFPH